MPVKEIPMATRNHKTRNVPVEAADSTAHLDLRKATPVVLPRLKPSTETISLRMPSALLETIRSEANRRDVPYQSLIKLALAEQFEKR